MAGLVPAILFAAARVALALIVIARLDPAIHATAPHFDESFAERAKGFGQRRRVQVCGGEQNWPA
jgi:hypothetical protein